MARFHASFSVGTVLGAATGAACIALDVGVTANLATLALVAGVAAYSATRWYLPPVSEQDPAPRPETARDRRARALRAWREPRTLLVGAFVFCAAFTEGSGGDWIAVALIDGHGASAVQGAFGYGCFVAAMTVSRLVAPSVLHRIGRVTALRAYGLVAIAGVALLAFAPARPLALVGCAVWGLGISLGFPVAMSAASDDPLHAAARVSVVSSIGYTAFIAGPPLLGLLADHVGILDSLTAIMAILAVGTLLAAATRPLAAPPTGPAAN
jgi:cyanate permease